MLGQDGWPIVGPLKRPLEGKGTERPQKKLKQLDGLARIIFPDRSEENAGFAGG